MWILCAYLVVVVVDETTDHVYIFRYELFEDSIRLGCQVHDSRFVEYIAEVGRWEMYLHN